MFGLMFDLSLIPRAKSLIKAIQGGGGGWGGDLEKKLFNALDGIAASLQPWNL